MHVGPVIAISDLERAKRFYVGQLGLTGEQTAGGYVVRADEGTVCYLLPDGVSTDQSGLQVAWMRDPDGSVLTVFAVAT